MLPAAPASAKFTVEHITALLYRTPTLVNFRTTRDAAFRFTPGHYARLGLGDGKGGAIAAAQAAPDTAVPSTVTAHGAAHLTSANATAAAGAPPTGTATVDTAVANTAPTSATPAGATPAGAAPAGVAPATGEAGADVWRPYSIASPAEAPFLDFQLTLVPGGDFCERFRKLKEGDEIRLDARAFGFLTLEQIAPGGTLWMFSTGTGLAPFISMLAADAVWQRHPRVVLVHSVRKGDELMPDLIQTAVAGRSREERERFTYLPIVTREQVEGTRSARLTELWRSGELERAGGAPLEAEHSRAMLCGNPEMIKEMRAMLKERAMGPARRGVPGQIAAEGYW